MNDRLWTIRRLTVSVAFCAVSVSAQVDTLTLSSSIERAMSNGPSLRVARDQFAARKARYESFRSGLYPQVSVQGQAPGYFRSITSVVQPDGSTVFAPQSQANTTVGLVVSQQIPWTGGELSLNSSLNRIDLLESKLTSYRSTPLSLTYRQPLFQLNTLGWNVETQDLTIRRSEREWDEALEDISIDITNKYFDAAVAALNMENASKNVQINDTLYQISVGRYNVGKIAENELLQNELAVLNARTQLANATTSYDRARRSLCYALGMPKESAVHLVLPETIPDLILLPERAVEEALRNRSDMIDRDLDLFMAERSVAEAEFSSSLSATMSVNAGLNQRAGTIPDAYRHLLDQQQFSVSFQVPIIQWGAGSEAVEAAKADQRRTLTTSEMRVNTIEDEVSAQVATLRLLSSEVGIAAKSETIAVRRFEVSKDRYLIGKIDVTNLFLAQNEKDSARRSRVQTLGEFWLGYYRLRRLTLYDFVANRPLRRPH